VVGVRQSNNLLTQIMFETYANT